MSGRELYRRIASGERPLSDGAMGSELIRTGITPGDVLFANIRDDVAVQRIHAGYLRAGADILTANTFGAFPGEAWGQCLIRGVEMAVEAANTCRRSVSVWVSLSSECVGRDRGELQSLLDHYGALPGMALIETVTSIADGCRAVGALRGLGLDLIAATCHFGMDRRLPDGTDPARAVWLLGDAGACIVGANCGALPSSFIEIASQIRAATSLPLLIQPNAGLPTRNGGGRWVYPIGLADFTGITAHLLDAGASLVGGCCGTTPQHTAAMRRLLARARTSRT